MLKVSESKFNENNKENVNENIIENLPDKTSQVAEAKVEKIPSPPDIVKSSNQSSNQQSDHEPSMTTKQKAYAPKGLKGLWKRIRGVRHFEIYAVGIVVLVMIAIYAGSIAGNTNVGGIPDAPPPPVVSDFARKKETLLSSTLSQIAGAGRVTTMVTVIGSPTHEIAYIEEKRTVTQAGPNGTTNTTTTVERVPKLVNGQPVIIQTINPQIVGVLITAQGANDPWIRSTIFHATRALLSDNSINIQVLPGR